MAKVGVKLSESDVTAQVRSYLEARGWRAIRMQRGMIRRGKGAVPIGEPGQPDWLFLRYVSGDKKISRFGCALAWHLWVEFKAPGETARCICAKKKPRQRCTACDQAAWHIAEIQRGGLVWQVDDYNQFTARYRLEFWRMKELRVWMLEFKRV